MDAGSAVSMSFLPVINPPLFKKLGSPGSIQQRGRERRHGHHIEIMDHKAEVTCECLFCSQISFGEADFSPPKAILIAIGAGNYRIQDYRFDKLTLALNHLQLTHQMCVSYYSPYSDHGRLTFCFPPLLSCSEISTATFRVSGAGQLVFKTQQFSLNPKCMKSSLDGLYLKSEI